MIVGHKGQEAGVCQSTGMRARAESKEARMRIMRHEFSIDPFGMVRDFRFDFLELVDHGDCGG